MKRHLHFLYIAVFFSASIFAQHSQGDTITMGSARYKLVSTNLIQNPGFEEDLAHWTDATSAAGPLSTANFTVVTSGGINNSRYLVGTKNENSSSAGSIGTGWSVSAGKTYYFAYHIKYLNASTAAGTEQWTKVSLTNDKNAAAEPLILLNGSTVNGGGQWTRNELVFTNVNPSYSFIVARFRWLGNRLGFDDFSLYEVEELVNTAALETVISEAIGVYKQDTPGAEELQAAITRAQGFLSSNSSAEVLTAITELQQAIRTYQLRNASAENPIDVTHFIVNPGFDQNSPTGWKGIGVINHRVVEFYQRTFNMHQKITGLPTGKYVLKAQGFERPRSNDAGSAYRAGTETIAASLYAKATRFPVKSSPFHSLYRHGYTGTGSFNGYVNTMTAAATFFATASTPYDIHVTEILLQEGDTLTIGARSDFQQSGYWALFDNFRLEYQGAFSATELSVVIDESVRHANELLSGKMQNATRTQLVNAISAAVSALETTPLSFDELLLINTQLNNASVVATTSIAAYSRLQSLIDEAEVVWPTLSGTKASNLLNAITLAKSRVNNLDVSAVLLNSSINSLSSQIYKRIYVPGWMLGNVNDPNNNWSMERSRQSKNWIVFWEPGYGEDPSVLADSNFRINIDGLLEIAERSFDFYADSLKFITRGRSKSDDYKMIIRLRYTRDWEATGSGVDDMIGLLTLTAWSAQVGGHTLAHEVAHCFQYQVRCDSNVENGWRYGFGPNASGGNGWWEQCAQWQAFKVYPTLQFTDGRFRNYLNTAHKHMLHEAPRYDNYFIHDYFTWRHGMDIIGRMWIESRKPEDPVEAYKRMTGISQEKFNDEMYERAALFTTWDLPALRTLGASHIDARPQTKMKSVGDNYWLIDPDMCLENYGYNVIKLNTPVRSTTVSAYFEGKAGMDGYRKNYVAEAGWRYGFVALLANGTRVYSEMGRASYTNPSDTLHFVCPDNCRQLWLVVSGAPSSHWRHAWDDNDDNDEQWPYQVKFNNTNLRGHQNVVNTLPKHEMLDVCIRTNANQVVIERLPAHSQINIFDVTGRCVISQSTTATTWSTELPSGMYIITLNKQSRYSVLVL